MKLIKQLGLQRSGTNALRAIAEENLPDCLFLANILGDKHVPQSWEEMAAWLAQNPTADGLTPELYALMSEQVQSRQLDVVISIKDPVSWLWSYFRYAKKKAEFKSPEQEFSITQHFANQCLASWSSRMTKYLNFALDNKERTMVVQHEELLRSPDAVLARFCNTFGLSQPDSPELFQQAYARRGIESQQGKDLVNPKVKFDPSYHLEGRWINEMPPEYYDMGWQVMESYFAAHPEFVPFFLPETLTDRRMTQG